METQDSEKTKRKSPPRGVDNQKPRRRRIRSELDRLLSDEGTRNMLKGLKKPKKPVFRGRVEGGKRLGVRGLVGRKRSSSKVSRRSLSPVKDLKVDFNCVNVCKRGSVGYVTVIKDVREVDRRRLVGGWGVNVLVSIDAAVREFEVDEGVSVVVVQNSCSRFFCNGVDLSELLSGGVGGGVVCRAMKSLIQTLNSCRKVLVASVSGDCVGFGVMVLPLFDLVYANDKSCFRVHYNALGQNPEGVGLLGGLTRGNGAGKIASLIYLNKSLTATEACQAGLVHEILWPARYQEELSIRLQSLSTQPSLLSSSKSIISRYRRNVKITDLNSEFSCIEEQWNSSLFQKNANGIVLAGDYEPWFWESSQLNGKL